MKRAYWSRVDGRQRSLTAKLMTYYVTLLAFCVFVLPAYAHELRPGIIDITQKDGQIIVTIETNIEAILAGIGSEHDDTDDAPQAQAYKALRALQPEALREAFEAQKDTITDQIKLSADGKQLTLSAVGLEIKNVPNLNLVRDSVFLVEADLPEQFAGLVWEWPSNFGESIIRIHDGEQQVTASEFLTAGQASQPFVLAAQPPQSGWSVFLNYIAVGFDHIVPKGLDHIVFVIGLFLFSFKLRPLLLQITAFTLAHTITLALGSLGLLSITPWIVESIIALSIVYVGLENIFLRKFSNHRIALVFGFGLLHGLGFAGVLADFGLPKASFIPALIGFNVGVEFGQLAVIAACLLLTFFIRNQSWYRKIVTIPISLVIALIGAYWVLERIGFLPESMSGLI